jgi:predicted nucleic-acid-binding protein
MNSFKTDEEIETEIKQIFNENKIEDLKKFMNKRKCLNLSNQIMNYLFHIVQSAGVLTTTIAAGYDIKQLVWIGVGMNILASLITVFEKTNDSISKKLLKDIQSIKNGTYIDERMLIEESYLKTSDKQDKKSDTQSDSEDLVEKGYISQTPDTKAEKVKQLLKTKLISQENQS